MSRAWSLLLSLPLAASYSFTFQNTPTQCGNVKISLSGSGTPPYRLSIIPSGGSPVQGGAELRKVLDMPFNDSSSISFTLPYPTNSQFVAVVSDKNGDGFGSGGATVPVNVEGSSDNSCLPKQQVSPAFTFSLDPDSLITCQPTEITWSSAQGSVKIWGVIGGGQSFVIPNTQPTTDKGQPAVSWTPQILPGVNTYVIVGDNRGFGSGGSAQQIVQPGTNDRSCINGNSPVSTSGSPAGGSYPTSTDGSGTGGGGSKTNIGAIVGGVVGGIAFIAILGIVAFIILRRRRSKSRYDERPVDLLDGRDRPPGEAAGEDQVPSHYVPQPYHIPEMTEGGHSSAGGLPVPLSERDRRLSGVTSTSDTPMSSDGMRPLSGTTTTAKSAAPPSLRPVNIVQHEDAGPSEEQAAVEPETVELPPAYTNLKKAA